ncbi:MAG: hypothetical protein Q8O86_08095 [Dehalococcoidia bacterium]|nr:hypothetical protein [Dehalococcoidia bacterium]
MKSKDHTLRLKDTIAGGPPAVFIPGHSPGWTSTLCPARVRGRMAGLRRPIEEAGLYRESAQAGDMW